MMVYYCVLVKVLACTLLWRERERVLSMHRFVARMFGRRANRIRLVRPKDMRARGTAFLEQTGSTGTCLGP